MGQKKEKKSIFIMRILRVPLAKEHLKNIISSGSLHCIFLLLQYYSLGLLNFDTLS